MGVNEQYNELISYTICESLYDSMRELTNYNNFNNMCSNIKDYINSETPITGELRLVMKSTILNITFLYGINDEETKKHLFNFFKKDVYVKYYNIVYVLKKYNKNCYYI